VDIDSTIDAHVVFQQGIATSDRRASADSASAQATLRLIDYGKAYSDYDYG
jgi:hypothetical protein